MEELDIVIVGGGVAGLATSLALHRDAYGLTAGCGLRVVIRNNLVRTLAHSLPLDTLRLGCQIVSVKLDEATSFPIVHLKNGQNIKAKVLIACDGSNSIVSEFLGLNPTKALGSRAVRGFTKYPDGHGFPQELIRIKMDNVVSGRLPITHKLVFWFVVLLKCPQDSNSLKNQEDVARLTSASVCNFSEEWKEMVQKCDIDSLYISRLRYRAPWDVLTGKFRRGTVTVAGDSMHLMGPFIGQGCSAALEDGVVLARCLWIKLGQDVMNNVYSRKRIEEAIDDYVRERRGRLVGLSTQTYLTGRLIEASSPVTKLLTVVLLMILFRDKIGHTRYDCGRL